MIIIHLFLFSPMIFATCHLRVLCLKLSHFSNLTINHLLSIHLFLFQVIALHLLFSKEFLFKFHLLSLQNILFALLILPYESLSHSANAKYFPLLNFAFFSLFHDFLARKLNAKHVFL